MEKVLVTGITGRIGANLASRLLEEGYHVRGLVKKDSPRLQKLEKLDIEVFYGDIRNPEGSSKSAEGMDVICHLGGLISNEIPESFEANCTGTLNMLQGAAEKGVGKFIFASTDALYDKYPEDGIEGLIDESFPVSSSSMYPLSKKFGEDLCSIYLERFGISTVCIRISSTAAADEILNIPQFYLGKLLEMNKGDAESSKVLRDLWLGEERLVLLRDRNGRPYKKHICDVRDMVSGIICAIKSEGVSGETVNLAGPEPIIWDKAIPYLSEAMGIPYVEASIPARPVFYEFDISKARSKLNYNPVWDTFKMIDSAIAFRNGEDIGVIPR